MRILASLTIILLLHACRHPLAIEGEGDIIDLNASGFGCTLEQFQSAHPACENNVQGDYLVNYSVEPNEGWEFSHWEGSCGAGSIPPNCKFDVPGAWVAYWDANFAEVPIPTLTAVFTAVDSDGDGVADLNDEFPGDSSESVDTDGDGVGDNADLFPEDASESEDTDGDGVGDNTDLFPSDAYEWSDLDADGVGDNSDSFPEDASKWVTLTPLNDTGLATGGNYPNGNNDTCIGETIDQQDCSNGYDASQNDDMDGHAGFSFTRLDIHGNEWAGADEKWSCVRDNITGLVWEVKTEDGSIHDKSKKYRWGGMGALENGGGEYLNDWDELVEGSRNNVFCWLR